MFALPISPVGQGLSLPKTCHRQVLGKKTSYFRRRLMFAVPTFLGRPRIVLAVYNMPVACFRQEKTSYRSRRSVFALPIFPGSRPPSIVSVHELNFCVRDGNRWTLMTINTNSCGWVLTHLLYDKACGFFVAVMVTHTGFEPMLTA